MQKYEKFCNLCRLVWVISLDHVEVLDEASLGDISLDHVDGHALAT